MSIHVDQVEAIIEYEREGIRGVERDVLAAVVRLRHDLVRVEEAIRECHRVPSSATGDPFVGGTARDLVRALSAREAAYQLVAKLERLCEKAGADS